MLIKISAKKNLTSLTNECYLDVIFSKIGGFVVHGHC